MGVKRGLPKLVPTPKALLSAYHRRGRGHDHWMNLWELEESVCEQFLTDLRKHFGESPRTVPFSFLENIEGYHIPNITPIAYRLDCGG